MRHVPYRSLFFRFSCCSVSLLVGETALPAAFGVYGSALELPVVDRIASYECRTLGSRKRDVTHPETEGRTRNVQQTLDFLHGPPLLAAHPPRLISLARF